MLAILFVAGKYLSFVLFSALGYWLSRRINEKEKKVETEIKKEDQSQMELLKRTAELQHRFEQLQNLSAARRKGKKINILPLLLLVIFTIMPPEPAFATADLYIPESYEELRALYILADREVRERDELILQYQELIGDYQKRIQELNLLLQSLQEINREKELVIAAKDQIITLQQKNGWGITGGLNIGKDIGYYLGVIRRYGSWGWLIHYSPPDWLSLGLGIYW